MPRKYQRRPLAATIHPEVLRLNKLRLELDLTYHEVATCCGITARALHHLVTEGGTPNHRTLHKIRAYMEQVRRAAGFRREGGTVEEATA